MEIKECLEFVASHGGEDFIRARDKAQAESMRVSAYYYRKQMPSVLKENIGIQVREEDSMWFLRIFDKSLDGNEHFERDPLTKKLIPKKIVSEETQRMVQQMKKDGKSEEEIKEALGNE